MGCNTFLPPDKVADSCGFPYMRDVDANALGHNTSFVPRVANNVLRILNETQKAQLVALTREQEPLLAERDPRLAGIRGEARFKKLLERVKDEWEHFGD